MRESLIIRESFRDIVQLQLRLLKATSRNAVDSALTPPLRLHTAPGLVIAADRDDIPCERPLGVGISYVEGTVRGPAGTEERVRFLIDSGATYSLLPEPVWQAIGLTPKRAMQFMLADGSSVQRSVSECHIALPHGEGHTPVVLGEPGDAEALLGVVTLEILGLVFDPFRRVLHPMRALMV
jgi:clan AA aspartic protease